MIYRHLKYNHTLEVGEGERVKRQVLERAGWKADKPPSEPSTGDNSPAPDGEKSAPKPRKTRKAAK